MPDIADNQEEEIIDFTPKRDKRKWIIAIVVITLLAIWLVPNNNDDDETPIEPMVQPELLAPPSSSQPANTEQTVVQLPVEVVQPQAAGDAARNLMSELNSQNAADLDRAVAVAQGHAENGQREDAYLLYFYAARAGHSKAAFTLARHADPNHFQPDGLYSEADIGQAYKWYTKAAELGESQATPALEALRATVTTAAAQGDSRAQRMVLQWK